MFTGTFFQKQKLSSWSLWTCFWWRFNSFINFFLLECPIIVLHSLLFGQVVVKIFVELMTIWMIFNVQVNIIGLVYSGFRKWHAMFLGWGSQQFKKDVCQKYDFIVMFYESNYFVMVVIRNPFSLSAHSPDFTFFMDWQQGSLTGLLFYTTWCDHLLQYHKKKKE